MYKILLAFSLFLVPVLANPDTNPIKKSDLKGELFITYPKSGTTLLQALIQLLTNKQILSIDPKNVIKNPNRLKLSLDSDKPHLYHSHSLVKELKEINQSDNKLLMIIRNYKECIVSYQKFSPLEFLNSVIKHKSLDDQGFCQYIENLQFFDIWKDEDSKLLIYYEDFITNPEKTIKQVAEFYNDQLVSKI